MRTVSHQFHSDTLFSITGKWKSSTANIMFYYHDTFEPKKFKFHVIIALVELMWV